MWLIKLQSLKDIESLQTLRLETPKFHSSLSTTVPFTDQVRSVPFTSNWSHKSSQYSWFHSPWTAKTANTKLLSEFCCCFHNNVSYVLIMYTILICKICQPCWLLNCWQSWFFGEIQKTVCWSDNIVGKPFLKRQKLTQTQVEQSKGNMLNTTHPHHEYIIVNLKEAWGHRKKT